MNNLSQNGLLQIFVGLGVSITSFFLNASMNSSKFTLLIFFGGAVFFYGVIKYALFKSFYKELPTKKEEQKSVQEPPHKTTSHNPTEDLLVCQNCATKHYPNANFCQVCGAKLKN